MPEKLYNITVPVWPPGSLNYSRLYIYLKIKNSSYAWCVSYRVVPGLPDLDEVAPNLSFPPPPSH